MSSQEKGRAGFFTSYDVLLPPYNASQDTLDILFTLKRMRAGRGWGGKDGSSFMKTLPKFIGL